jgi:predicted GIY-YIG superfamily endonuclease
MSNTARRFVYILRSERKPDEPYVGSTCDVAARLKWHNHGPDGYTRKYRPWCLQVAIEFADESTALRFECYLKSGSGRAFAKRHFAPGT